jgi:hypothetical protein
MYRHLYTLSGEIIEGRILRLIDNTIIPFDPANTDYQAYLEWIAEGNQPLPAEETP